MHSIFVQMITMCSLSSSSSSVSALCLDNVSSKIGIRVGAADFPNPKQTGLSGSSSVGPSER